MFFSRFICTFGSPLNVPSCSLSDALVVRRRNMFIVGVVSLWDTLVTPPKTADTTADFRDKLTGLTTQLSKCLAKEVPPQPPLSKRPTFPAWIPRDCLDEDEDSENDPPPRGRGRARKSITEVDSGKPDDSSDDDDEEANMSLAEFQEVSQWYTHAGTQLQCMYFMSSSLSVASQARGRLLPVLPGERDHQHPDTAEAARVRFPPSLASSWHDHGAPSGRRCCCW